MFLPRSSPLNWGSLEHHVNVTQHYHPLICTSACHCILITWCRWCLPRCPHTGKDHVFSRSGTPFFPPSPPSPPPSPPPNVKTTSVLPETPPPASFHSSSKSWQGAAVKKGCRSSMFLRLPPQRINTEVPCLPSSKDQSTSHEPQWISRHRYSLRNLWNRCHTSRACLNVVFFSRGMN